ncbi:glucokinase [Litorivivens lipolytica]|uniref:Glucokinase n=1 Tax=Litorivivens lipolytica TaxID=1524264 RepID=A0A7W4W5R7_9GAMM|nr:glucokinase [Litorivivens lipolytica]MBB3047935.1 glucokinase [Litorivivens lipolytica]
MHNPTQAIYIVADIGGTNARFAWVRADKRDLNGIEKFPCADFPLFVEAVRAYINRGHAESVAGICLAVAGPVEQDWIDLPNNHWAFSRRELEQQLGMPVTIINDFSAQVLSIAALREDALHWIGEPRPATDQPGVTAVLGPGTGLGVSGMMPSGEIIPSEGGHVGFAPTTRHQSQLLDVLWTRYERVSVERLLSGMGLANLYWANARLLGQEKELPAPEVTTGARAGDTLCVQAVKDFTDILGAVAGDTALAMGAYKGVYLSGGILPQMMDVIDVNDIRRSFEFKGRFSPLCAEIPLAIIVAEHPGLVGCAQALKSS